MNRETNLNILHAVLSLDCGGLERLVLYLCKEGIAAGDQVTVLCLDHPGELAGEIQKAGARMITLNRKPGLMRLSEAVRLRALVKQTAPDIIHCHQMTASFYVSMAAKTLNIPAIVHTEHGIHDYSGWRRRLLASLAFRSVNKIYCVSQNVADNLATRYRLVAKNRLAVQANGIPVPAEGHHCTTLTREQLGIDKQATLYGTVGRLARIKRQERLLNAIAALARMGRKVHLILVGEGACRAELEQLADELEINHLVHFAGFQLDPLPWIMLLDVFVLTSDSEGMPMALLEAWAARKPVVVTAVGGLPELVSEGKTGLLAPPDDQQRLVSNLDSLATNPEQRNRLGNNGYTLVTKKYSAERTARTYREGYLSLLH